MFAQTSHFRKFYGLGFYKIICWHFNIVLAVSEAVMNFKCVQICIIKYCVPYPMPVIDCHVMYVNIICILGLSWFSFAYIYQ